MIKHNILSPNCTEDHKNFHISYCSRTAVYGCCTTAIVLKHRVFLVLDGDHRAALSTVAARPGGIVNVMNYFVANIRDANPLGEHRILAGLGDDVFAIIPTALEVIGKKGIDLIKLGVAE